jgi:transcriptional regulator with XRE-family HTH domain
MSLGDNIRRIRRAKNLSQDQLANLAGLSRPTVSMIEGGKNAEQATINAIAKALNVSVSELNQTDNAPKEISTPYSAPAPKEEDRVYTEDEAVYIKGRLDFWRRAYLKLAENERYKIIDAICAIYPEGLREVFIDWCKKP